MAKAQFHTLTYFIFVDKIWEACHLNSNKNLNPNNTSNISGIDRVVKDG